jgi:hypothetical protein
MSLSFVQEPVDATEKVPVITNWTPLIGYMLYYNASIASLFYFKLILEIRIDDASGTLLGKVKQRRNGYSTDIANNKARAYFDLRDIVNTQLVNTVYDQNQSGVPFESIHTLGSNTGATTKIFSQNGNIQLGKSQIQQIYVKGYFQSSSSASASPQEDATGAVNSTLFYMQGALPLFTPRSVIGGSVDTDYLQGDNMAIYCPNGTSKKFLSDLQLSTGDYISGTFYRNYIQSTDYHTLAFLNGQNDFNTSTYYMEIAYYDSSNGLIGSKQYLINDSGNGGAIPATSGGEVNTDEERLLYFGCGAGNLEASTIDGSTTHRPSNFTNWAYYTIRVTSNNTGTISYQSLPYYFIKQDASCKGFKIRRLAFRNSLGCYDYFNFKKKSTQTVNVERNNYSSMLGTFNKSKWRYDDYQRGKTTRQTTAVLQETLNTDWITEQDADLIEKLIMSTDVYVVENDDTTYTQAVMVTSSSHIRKTQANDGMKIQYTINIEYANPLNTNS